MNNCPTEEIELASPETALSEKFLSQVLSSLVRTKSINPGTDEIEMANCVADWLRPTAAEVTFVDTFPNRPSVGAVIEGARSGPKLVLNGHMDTVPIDALSEWTTDPFGGEVIDGWLYGRGACDMKAGLAVQIGVAHYITHYLDDLQGSLILHFAVGEECAEPGTTSLLESGFTGDFGIVTEPTELKVAVAARGIGHYYIHIKGRSIHASKAHLGVNPILSLGSVLDTIKAYESEIQKREHPLVPSGTCTPTIVQAGIKENAVPDFCDVTVDRRLMPGETVNDELEALRLYLDKIKNGDRHFVFDITRSKYGFEPAEINHESPFALSVKQAAEDVIGESVAIYGTPFASDVRNLVNEAGIEAITFGPGNVAECHCADERVEIRQLENAGLTIARVARNLFSF